ncbi:LysR family transcriptional regulator [Aquincola sp. J276]|uniref:LysR family transcriptional regulator n=1 Tax=Aquincola sp. J276 TaxID=2898432 RepID=UPI002151A4D8|nr:LysR family transcriptional regulator [Aquincola sp. J276]MCR5864333.1 LysR family transcriptional regulator [Aquincola sp. J276]
MDAVSDLAFFVMLSQRGSLAACAQVLGVTPPTVSKRLAALERRLGVRLLNRTTRRMALTAEGEAYVAEGSRLIAELAQLEQRVAAARGTPRGLLRVHATLGFGRRYIAPLVSRFMQQHADVDVLLQLSDKPPGRDEGHFDVMVRVGELRDARLNARRLAPNRRLLVASPLYLKQAGEPRTPAELHAHGCIVIRQDEETFGSWQLRQGSRSETVKVRGRCSTNDGETAMAWALDGHGILLRSEWDAAPYLRSGRLQQVLPGWTVPSADIHAVYPTQHNLAARTRAFIDFLAEGLADRRPTRRGAGGW